LDREPPDQSLAKSHNRDGEISLYARTVIVADLALSFLTATLAAGVGVLISLHSVTIQQAMQPLMALFLLTPMLLGMPVFLFPNQIGTSLSGHSTSHRS
jgi:hypothetical protein